jgi:hypothetical protein
VKIDGAFSMEKVFQQQNGLKPDVRLLQDNGTYRGQVYHSLKQNLQLGVVDTAVFKNKLVDSIWLKYKRLTQG